ncbi:MAG TPA: G8 domain-containing protein, partial [Thermoleophilaceae bacterium]|nr:G8 domain-containing protein [Thermoleophilaceae bacterium]
MTTRRTCTTLTRLVAVAAALVAWLAMAAEASAATNTFQGPGDQWNAAGNWSQASVPDATDDVVIPSSRAVVLDTTAGEANSLDLDGQLHVSGTSLTLGAGTSSIGGSLQITGGGTVALSAVTTWSGGGISFGGGGGTLHVGAGDVLGITGADLVSLNFGGGLWRNDGTVNRTTSATTAQIGVPFENDGAVNVNTGTL